MLFSDFLKNIITQLDNFKAVERKKETLDMPSPNASLFTNEETEDLKGPGW